MKVATFTVLPFGDDQIDCALDVGVVLVDRCSDVAVGNGAAEVIGKAPLAGQAFLDTGQVMLVNAGDVVINQAHTKLARLEHGFDEGASGLVAMHL